MEKGMLDLHSVLRWIIIVLLFVTIYQAFSKNKSLKKSSLWLMICAHTMLGIGLYQLLLGRFGMINKGLPAGTSLMKDSFYRFYWVEHPLLMIVAIVLITMARGKAKAFNYKAAGWLLVTSLIFILVAVPWPFRGSGIGRHLLPGM
ncbi:MAG: hypothetical protein JST23_03040 [Bacteroidetes bacterium]|nr:hypothetical protein [Bacteroidota bacterium]